MNLIPTVLLALAFNVVAWRAAERRSLRAAAWALMALGWIDFWRQLLVPTVATWGRGEAIGQLGAWLVRLDGALLAGVWPGVVAALLLGPRDLLLGPLYGVAAVAIARAYPAAWLGLLLAPRFAVGALGWHVAFKTRAPAPSFRRARRRRLRGRDSMPRLARDAAGASRWRGQHNLSTRIALIIAASEVGCACFLWWWWGGVQVISCACWLACAWVAWTARPPAGTGLLRSVARQQVRLLTRRSGRRWPARR